MASVADKWAPQVPPDASIAKVAVGALNGRLDAVLNYLPRAALRPQEDAEYVHQLRVWTRRAVAALRLYEDLIPKRQLAWFRKVLRHVRRAANDARDADVLIERLHMDKRNGTQAWLETLQSGRATAQNDIVRVYEQLNRNQRLQRRAQKLLERVAARGQRRGGRKPFHKWARVRLARDVRDFFAAAPEDQTDDTALHRFRIRAKILRYTIELFAGAFPDELRSRIYPEIESIQDRLGEINDHATAKAQLEGHAANAKSPTQAANWKRFRDHEDTVLEHAKEAFRHWCTPARLRKLQNKFEKLLEAKPRTRKRSKPAATAG